MAFAQAIQGDQFFNLKAPAGDARPLRHNVQLLNVSSSLHRVNLITRNA